MTTTYYTEQKNKIFEDVPPEFYNYIHNIAFSPNDTTEEYFAKLRKAVSEIKESIEDFEERILNDSAIENLGEDR